ncbi:putative Transcriptional regulator, MarR family [metagenome]|uniref:Putative Transcriptional regulator, MarR family n=1 Tax=metagenome TaxID=256318 RepID=A0A2P2C8V4_9ZZZZ
MPKTGPTTAQTEAAALRYAAQRLTRRLRKQVHNSPSPSRMSLLSTVERHGSISMARLRDLEQVSKSTLTRLVARVESDGHLVRVPDPDDGRGFVVSLTPEGSRILRQVAAVQDDYLARQLEALEESDRIQLQEAVTAIERLLAARA